MRSVKHVLSFVSFVLAFMACQSLVAQTSSAPPPNGLPKILFYTDSNTTPQLPTSSTWIWNGQQYVGNWTVYANGQYFLATGQMRIKSFDGRQHLTIQRTDESGFLGGMSILYEGDWDGTQILNGKGVYSYNGARGMIKWSAAKVPTISPDEAAKLFLSGSTGAVYPGMARNAHVNGEARLEFTIRPDGTVTDVASLTTQGPMFKDFADSATQAILQSKFRPYMSGGVPTAVRTSVTYKFTAAAGVERVPKY